jgi:hypothetical protein
MFKNDEVMKKEEVQTGILCTAILNTYCIEGYRIKNNLCSLLEVI